MKHLILFLAMAFSVSVVAQTSAWIQKEDLPGNSRTGAISFSIGTKVYLGFGSGNSDFYEYDTQANLWTVKSNLPLSTGINDCSAFSIDGYGYVLTARPNASNLPRFYRYDPENDNWTQLDLNLFDQNGASIAFNINSGRSASFVINGKAYIGTGSRAAGYCSTTAIRDFYEYDPVTNMWRILPPFPGVIRDYATGFALEGKGYIGSGRYYQPPYRGPRGGGCREISQIYSDFYRFDPVTESWEAIESFPGGNRYGMASFVIGNKAYVGGGNTGDGDFYTYDTENGWAVADVFSGGLKRNAIAAVVGIKAYYGTGFQNGGSTKDFWEFSPDIAFQGLASTGLASPAPLCPGSTFIIGAISYGILNDDNAYNVLLSDASGSFENTTTIGSLEGSAPSANITCTLPGNISPGSYAIRLESTSPVHVAEIGQAIQVYDIVPAPFIRAQQLCYGSTLNEITGYNGNVVWYSEPENGVVLNRDEPLQTGTYYASRLGGQCESARLAVPVVVESYITPPQPLSLSYCSITYINTANQSIPDGDPDTLKVWYAAPESVIPLYTYTILQQSTYYVCYKKGSCESARVPVTVTINSYLGDTEFPNLTLCYGATLSDATAQLLSLTPSTDVQWYSSPNTDNLLSEDTIAEQSLYYIKLINGPCQSDLMSIQINYQPAPYPPFGEQVQNPDVQQPTLADLIVIGTNIQWYSNVNDAYENANQLTELTPLIVGATYYAMQTVNGCRSNSPLEVLYTPLAGIDSALLESVRIWPNPVSDGLYFSSPGNALRITIFNLMGQQVTNEELDGVSEGVISTNTLVPGTYIVKILSENGVIQLKVIKQ